MSPLRGVTLAGLVPKNVPQNGGVRKSNCVDAPMDSIWDTGIQIITKAWFQKV
jgi:hypothetical protein